MNCILKIGDRVQLSELGKKNSRTPDKKGVIVGLPKSSSKYQVKWDGVKLPQVIHRTYVEYDRS